MLFRMKSASQLDICKEKIQKCGRWNLDSSGYVIDIRLGPKATNLMLNSCSFRNQELIADTIFVESTLCFKTFPYLVAKAER